LQFVRFFGRNGSLLHSTSVQLDVLNASSGNLIKRIDYTVDEHVIFFPDYSRYALSGAGSVEIHDLKHHQALAILPATGFLFFDRALRIAPDGNTIFARPYDYGAPTNAANFLIYRRTGWDSPESPLGLLVFPSTWLLIASLTGTAISLLRDAQRQGDSSSSPSRVLLYSFWAITLVVTIHFTIEACRGVLVRSPAPVLLIAACGLASGSRVWRGICLVLLVHTLGWCCIALNFLRGVQEDAYPLFDRVYELPHQVRMSALTATTAAIIAAIVMLLLPRGTARTTN